MTVIKTYTCVIGVVKFKDKILLLKRAPTRKMSPNKWQPPSGYIKEKEAAEDAVLREVKEETGIDGHIAKAGKTIVITDRWGRWVDILFLINTKSTDVKIDREEHSDWIWLKPKEISNYNLVKGVREDLEAFGLLK